MTLVNNEVKSTLRERSYFKSTLDHAHAVRTILLSTRVQIVTQNSPLSLLLIFCLVTVREAYGHAPGSASVIAFIANSCPISCSRYCRIATKTSFSFFRNGEALPVLMVVTIIEVHPKSVMNAAKALRFS